MSNKLHFFSTLSGTVCVAAPIDIIKAISDWENLRHLMAKQVPEGFSRDEWAYLISFLDRQQLESIYLQNIGKLIEGMPLPVKRLLRTRGIVAIWLPNNVSLLGPLLVVLCSLSGNAMRIKGGSQSDDLTGIFLQFAKDNLPDGQLKDYLRQEVEYSVFSHEDQKDHDFFGNADVGIIFGSDEAVGAVKNLPQPLSCICFPFTNRHSEVWLEADAITDDVLINLLKVFAVYGQAGCTSPAKTVLLNGTILQAVELRDRLSLLWDQAFRREPPMHIASNNVMAYQWAKAGGWQPVLASNNAAVIAAGTADLTMVNAEMTLHIVFATIQQAVDLLPASIQTIGYALSHPEDAKWLEFIAKTPVKRFVPIANMHHFGPIWDGYAFWRNLFEEVEVVI